MVLPVPGVGELGDVLQPYGRLPAAFQPLLQRHSNVNSRPLLLNVFLSRGVLGIFWQAHNFSLLFTGLSDVLVSSNMVPQGLEVFKVTITDQTEEKLLLSGRTVLVTEIVWNCLSTFLKVQHVNRSVLEVYVLTGSSDLHDTVGVDIDPSVRVHAGTRGVRDSRGGKSHDRSRGFLFNYLDTSRKLIWKYDHLCLNLITNKY